MWYDFQIERSSIDTNLAIYYYISILHVHIRKILRAPLRDSSHRGALITYSENELETRHSR